MFGMFPDTVYRQGLPKPKMQSNPDAISNLSLIFVLFILVLFQASEVSPLCFRRSRNLGAAYRPRSAGGRCVSSEVYSV